MHVIITGGTGLIGQALTADLLQDGHQVTVLTRAAHRASIPEGANIQQWDARTANGWGHLVEDTDAIVNLAGENIAGQGLLPKRWTAERKRQIHDSRIQAGEAITQAIMAASHTPQILIQASGIGYYGPLGDELVTETHPPGGDFLARLAVEWEASTSKVEERGIRRAIIRTSAVLSAKGGALPRLILPYKLFVGGPLGSGHQYLPWIHLTDEVGAIRFLLNNNVSGPFNLVAPQPLTNAEFGKVVGRVLKRPSLLPAPGFAMRLMLGEVSTLVLEGQRALPKRLEEAGFTFRFPEAEVALRDLLRE